MAANLTANIDLNISAFLQGIQKALTEARQFNTNVNKAVHGITPTVNDTAAKAGFKKLEKEAENSSNTIADKFKNLAGGQAGGILSALGGGAAVGLATGGIAALVSGVVGLGKAMISTNQEFETYKTQLGTLLGSADMAKDRIEELAKFGAETPFDLPELIKAEKVLIGFGLQGEKALKLTGKSAKDFRTIVGDVAAGTGVNFEELSITMGKLSSGATGEALSRLQELGIVTREQLKGMGVEFSKSNELLSPLPVAMQAVTKQMEAKFGGGMAALSQTAGGQLSTLQDNFDTVLRNIGGPLFDKFKTSVGGVNDIFNSGEFQAGVADAAKVLGLWIEYIVTGAKTIGSFVEVGFKLVSTLLSFGSSGKESVSVLDAIGAGFTFVTKSLQATTVLLEGVSGGLDAIKNGSVFDFFSGFQDGAKKAEQEIKNADFETAAAEKAEKIKAQVSAALSDGLAIKEKIDKNGKLTELQEDFKNAKTEFERNSIAKAIAEQVPQAVTEMKPFLDENGKLQTQYEINIDKVGELQKANEKAFSDDLKSKQGSFLDGFKQQAAQLDANKDKLAALGAKIAETNEKGGDTSKLREQYKELETSIKANQEALNGTIGSAKQLGIDGPENVIKIAKELGYSEDAALKLATQVDKVATALKDAKGLAEDFTKGLSDSGNVLDTAKNALSENQKLQAEARKDQSEAGKQRLLELQAQEREIRAGQKQALKDKLSDQRLLEKNDIEKQTQEAIANNKKVADDRKKAEKDAAEALAKARLGNIADLRLKEAAEARANYTKELAAVEAREKLTGKVESEYRTFIANQLNAKISDINKKFDKQEADARAARLKQQQEEIKEIIAADKEVLDAIKDEGSKGDALRISAQIAALDALRESEMIGVEKGSAEALRIKDKYAKLELKLRADMQKALERFAAGEAIKEQIENETDLLKKNHLIQLSDLEAKYQKEREAAANNAALMLEIDKKYKQDKDLLLEQQKRDTDLFYGSVREFQDRAGKGEITSFADVKQTVSDIAGKESKKQQNQFVELYKKGEDSMGALAASTAASFVQAFAVSKSFGEAIKNTILATIDAVAAGASARIFFESLSLPDSVTTFGVAGFARASMLVGFVQTAATTAKAIIGSIPFNFKDGVVNLAGPGTWTSDSIPANLSRGETVVPSDATAKNIPALSWLVDTRGDLKSFFAPEIERELMIKLAPMFDGLKFMIAPQINISPVLPIHHVQQVQYAHLDRVTNEMAVMHRKINHVMNNTEGGIAVNIKSHADPHQMIRTTAKVNKKINQGKR